MKDLIAQFENKAPEIVFEWNDYETGARGWVVINSLRGGAAGGGTRMRKGLTKDEVVSLAKTMEIKFAFSGPAIGGAKSGIDFDPFHPDKNKVLKKWYERVVPILKNYYGTGGDLNVDEVRDVIPVTESLGLLHPQEGVLVGHFKPDVEQKEKKIYQLREGVSKVISDSRYSPSVEKKYVVADMITGYGLAESVKHFYGIYGGNLQGKKVIVQGWGNVASAAAFFLANDGAKIVGIIDRHGGLINEEGFSFEEIRQLFINKDENRLAAPYMLSFEVVNTRIWDLSADVFLPSAASRLVEREHLDRLKKAGVSVISSGANVPFNEDRIFYGDVTAFADENFSLIPDFIANSGMARTFAYLMQDDISLDDHSIFFDVSECIRESLVKVHAESNSPNKITATAFGQAINKLL